LNKHRIVVAKCWEIDIHWS